MPRQSNRLLLPSYLAMLGVGMNNSLPGAIFPQLAPTLGLSTADMGGLVSITFIGIMLLMLVTHRLTAWFGRKRLILLNIVLECLGAGVLALAGSKAMLALGVALLGAGFGLQGAMLNGLFTRLYGDSPAQIGALNSMFGLGGLVLPAGLLLLTRAGLPWTWVFALAMGLNLAAGLLFLPLALPDEEVSVTTASRRLDWRAAFWILLFFLAYGGAETAMGQLMPTFLTQTGRATAGVAAFAAGLYWGTLALGRLVLGPVVKRMGMRRFLLAFGGSSAIVAALFSVAPGPLASFVLPMLFGLALAMLWPTGIVVARSMLPGVPAQQIVGATGFTTSMGSLLVPALAGWLAGQFAPAAILLSISGSLLVLLVTVPMVTPQILSERA